VGDTGLEHTAESPAKQALSETGGAISGAVSPDSGPTTPAPAPLNLPSDVAELARRLAALPEAVQASLLVAVNAAQPQERRV